MRVNCKFYESRTYASGEVVRMCRLDMAPEAPWRCPENCPSYQRKIIDGGWVHGSLANKPTPDEPPALDEHAVSLLDEAENLINSVGPSIVAEENERRAAQRAAEQAKARRKKRWWWPFG